MNDKLFKYRFVVTYIRDQVQHSFAVSMKARDDLSAMQFLCSSPRYQELSMEEFESLTMTHE